jgi:hypothetical protein
MNQSMRRRFIALFVCLALLIPARPARASLGSDVAWVAVAIVVVTAAITTAVVMSVRRSPTVTGCAADGPNGLQLQSEGDQQTFLLTGDTIGIKAGDRVKVQGKKSKDPSGNRHFLVERFKKDYGTCKAVPATP